MGAYFCIGNCCGCGYPFTFNPHRVPSVGGEPVCQACMDLVNRHREVEGREPLTIPLGAYEPVEEGGAADFLRDEFEEY